MLDATAEAVREFVFAQQVGEALDLALIGRDQQRADFLRHQGANLLDEGGDRAVEAQRRARGKFDFAEGLVFIEDVNDAELVNVEAGV